MDEAPLDIHAVWDEEAGSWSAASREQPDLRVEAATYEELIDALTGRAGGRALRIQASGFPGCGC